MKNNLENISLLIGAVAVGVFIYQTMNTKAAIVALSGINTDGASYTKTNQNDIGVNLDVVGGALTWV